MKSIIQLLESLRILFIRSNLQTRTALILCTLLLGVGVGLMVQNANLLSKRMEYLLDGQDFTPEQLDRFELAFSAGCLRHYERVGNRMRIPSSTKDAYLKALSQAKCLPVHTLAQIESASDPLRFLEPRSLAKERERKERIRQIESTLKEFPFVRQAVVTYDEKTEGFAPEKSRAATVAIHPKNKPHLTRSERRSIIRLVHMHFSGLKASEVVLVDLGVGETFTEPSLDSDALGHLAQSDSHWTDRRREHEDEIKRKAMELLAGYGDVQIVVTSEPIGADPNDDSISSSQKDGANNEQQAPSTIPNRKARLGEMLTAKEIIQSIPTYVNRISVSIPASYYRRAYRHEWNAEQGGADASAGVSMSTVASSIPAISDRGLEQLKAQTMRAIREKLSPLVSVPAAWEPSGGAGSEIESRVVITDHLDSVEPFTAVASPLEFFLQWLTESWRTLGLFATVILAMLLLKSLSTGRGARDNFELRESSAAEKKQASDISYLDLQEQPPSIEQEMPLAKSSMTLSMKVQSHPEQVAARLATWISQN